MIAFLKGQLYHKAESENQITIDCNGVGYEVFVSLNTLQDLPKAGEGVFIEIYHHISEAEQRLFGFKSKQEKAIFELIITVKGIGPRLGLAVLSGMTADKLASAIASGDLVALSGISGIGKKTAERIVLELREKIGKLKGVQIDDSSASEGSSFSNNSEIAEEAISALEALGYRRPQATKAVQDALKADNSAISDSKSLIKKALIHLNT